MAKRPSGRRPRRERALEPVAGRPDEVLGGIVTPGDATPRRSARDVRDSTALSARSSHRGPASPLVAWAANASSAPSTRVEQATSQPVRSTSRHRHDSTADRPRRSLVRGRALPRTGPHPGRRPVLPGPGRRQRRIRVRPTRRLEPPVLTFPVASGHGRRVDGGGPAQSCAQRRRRRGPDAAARAQASSSQPSLATPAPRSSADAALRPLGAPSTPSSTGVPAMRRAAAGAGPTCMQPRASGRTRRAASCEPCRPPAAAPPLRSGIRLRPGPRRRPSGRAGQATARAAGASWS
jgi:hypothetical protein